MPSTGGGKVGVAVCWSEEESIVESGFEDWLGVSVVEIWLGD